MAIKRGDIFYIYKSPYFDSVGSEQHAGRPGIIVSNQRNNAAASTVEVVYLTTQHKNDLPTHIAIRSTERASVALCEQINTVSINRVGDYYGRCSDSEMQMIDTALAISLGLNFGDTKPKTTASSPLPQPKTTASSPLPQPKTPTNDKPNNTPAPDVLRITAERDVYKHLCEQMLEKLAK